tara:strand:+ start:979 stop:1311 length:333 start_codon:yes stop_codon:yes gene_type:complete
MRFKKIIIFLFSILFLFSCTNAKNALQGKKRSDNSDEFLVEKKNPLTVPPDMDELPVPLDQEVQNEKIEEEKSLDIKKVLKIEENQETNTNKSNKNQNNLEKSILEKINN